MERGHIKITKEEIGKPIVEAKIANDTTWIFKHEIVRLFDERGKDIYTTYYNLEAIIFLSCHIGSYYAKA